MGLPEFNRTTNTGFLSAVGCMGAIFLFITGCGMQAYANETNHAFIVAFLFLITGIFLVIIFSPRAGPELRAFLLTYAICVFVGGLSQCYSLVYFHSPQSTEDALKFFPMISRQPPFTTMAKMPLVNAPLAVLIWQQAYKLTWWIGLKFGPYTGIMFNAFLMGMTGSITVLIARELFGDDYWRLRRVGTLFALCGLFILFGSILIRDCFLIFFNALVILGLVHWLCRPSFRNFCIAIVITGISTYAIVYLRYKSIVMVGLFFFVAIIFRVFSARMNVKNIIIIFIFTCVLLLSISYLLNYVKFAMEFQSEYMQKYSGNSAATYAMGDSLGMRLVVHQPLPIRLPLGCAYLMVFPIPIWGYLQLGANEYILIKGYHGIYQMIVFPLTFSGYFLGFKEYLKGWKQSIPFLFLAIYFLMSFGSVVATTLEQRHLAQFMPAFIVLAALPDTREKRSRTIVGTFLIIWLFIVSVVNLLWVFVKY